MSQSPDKFAALPVMPRHRRKRLKSHRLLMVVVVLSVLLSLAGLLAIKKHREGKMADALARNASDLFRRGAFRDVERKYGLFQQKYPNHPLAKDVAEIKELSRLVQSIGDSLTDPESVVTALDKVLSETTITTATTERWMIVFRLAERATRSHLEYAKHTLDVNDLEAGRVWLKWLYEQQRSGRPGSESLVLEGFQALVSAIESRVATEKRRSDVLTSLCQAVSTGTRAQFAAAFNVVGRWRSDGSVVDADISAAVDQLAQAVRDSISFRSPEKVEGTARNQLFRKTIATARCAP